MASKTEISKWLERLREGWATSPILSKGTLEIWSASLAKYPLEVLVAAAPLLSQREKFFPNSLAVIIDACDEIMGSDYKIPLPGEAYEELMHKVMKIGIYGAVPEFSHPAIAEAMGAVGGWRYLCSSQNMVSDRARFFEVYGHFRERAERQEKMPEITKEVAKKFFAELTDRASERELENGYMGPIEARNTKKMLKRIK